MTAARRMISGAHRRGYRLHPEAAPGHAGGQEGQRRHRGVGAEPAQALPRLPPGPGQGRPQRCALQRLRVPL